MAKQPALYQQALIDHHKNPIGFEKAINANFSAQGSNNTCGDEITVSASIENGIFNALSFHDDSCAICRASASLLCQELENQSVEYAQLTVKNIAASVNQQQDFDEKFMPLSSIAQYPVRKQCALLPWQTLTKIIHQYCADKVNPQEIQEEKANASQLA